MESLLDEEIIPKLPPTYEEETEALIIRLVTGKKDDGEIPLSVRERLSLIQKSRQEALDRLADMGRGSHVDVVADRLNLLNKIKKEIFKNNRDARKIQRQLDAPKRAIEMQPVARAK